jgi:hypothetical protein
LISHGDEAGIGQCIHGTLGDSQAGLNIGKGIGNVLDSLGGLILFVEESVSVILNAPFPCLEISY